MTAEDLLTRTFTGVTETTEYPTTPMATVVARSRAIRGGRRRRVAALAAAAVVVAGGLSATLLLGHDGDSTPAPTGPLGELPQGPAPKLDYLDGDTFVASTGTVSRHRRSPGPRTRCAGRAGCWSDVAWHHPSPEHVDQLRLGRCRRPASAAVPRPSPCRPTAGTRSTGSRPRCRPAAGAPWCRATPGPPPPRARPSPRSA